MSVNKVFILGNVGRDPETRYMPSGDAVTNMSVATSDKYKDKQSGEMKEVVEWHRIAFFGKLAEVAGQYLKKGSKVHIEGRLRTREWEKDGEKKNSTEIIAERMEMLDGKPQDGGQQQPSSNPPAGNSSGSKPSAKDLGAMDDDIPF